MMNKISMTSEFFFEELPGEYYVEFLVQEKNVFHGIADETDWISNALFFQRVKIRDLVDLMTQYADHNLYRSWIVYDEENHEIDRVPAYLDIDGDYRKPNLDDAYKATMWLVDTAKQACQFSDNAIRVVFSGQKGFHVEFRKPGEFSIELYNLLEACPEFNSYFGSGGLVLDKQWNRFGWKKNYTRLHNSTNTTDQDTSPRLCFTMTVEKFRNTQLSGILQEAENAWRGHPLECTVSIDKNINGRSFLKSS